MARKRATGDTQDKLNRVTEEYEKAQKLSPVEDYTDRENLAGEPLIKAHSAALATFDKDVEEDQDLDNPRIKGPSVMFGTRTTDRDGIRPEKLNAIKQYRATNKLKKAESE